MPELTARFVRQNERQEKIIEEKKTWPLVEGQEVILQRELAPLAPRSRSTNPLPIWSAPWDGGISRRGHIKMIWDGQHLHVQVTEGKPPAWFHQKTDTEFSVALGDEFWLGRTLFSVGNPSAVTPVEKTCSPEDVQRSSFVTEATRLDALAELPELIRRSADDRRLHEQIAQVLFDGVVDANQAAVVSLANDATTREPALNIHALQQRGVIHSEPRISRRLVYRAIQRREPLIHSYEQGSDQGDVTVVPDVDWAMCIPLQADGYEDWAFYLAGRFPKHDLDSNEATLNQMFLSDLKFAQVVAETFGALMQSRELERRLSLVGRVLPPVVRSALRDRNLDEVLTPREVDVTVLFCDLRNSCEIISRGGSDLMRLWDEVRQMLEVMTRAIIAQDGVIGDFQGDAAMGFWGWPFKQTDQIQRAARAALNIRRYFTLANARGTFEAGEVTCGLGLAHGKAVAGRLGAWDQSKIGVFGPVVNRAARLESFTKQVAVPIVIDEAIGRILSEQAGGKWRTRRLTKIRLKGIDEPVLTYELLPVDDESGPNLSEGDRLNHEAALDAFMQGDWERLDGLIRHREDEVSKMFKHYVAEHPDGPPPGWDGVIPLVSK